MRFEIEQKPSDLPGVERIWRARGEHPGTFISEAKVNWEIVGTAYQGKTVFTIRGPESRATPIDFNWTGAEFFGIVFKLGTFMPHLPPQILRDGRDVNLPGAAGRSFWLRGAAWEFPNFENADTFIARLVREDLLACEPLVDAVLSGRPRELSPRSVQYRFLRATGLDFRTLQQIERARRAAALLERGVSILDTVFEAGYTDQPHLTRSLKRFLGQTPAQILRLRQIS